MKQLHDFITRHRETQWISGESDCALFVAAWLQELHGTDYAAEYRGQYTTTEEGLALVGGLKNKLTELFGEPDAILTARRGDIAYRTTDGGETVGVVIGTRVACPGEKGLYFSTLTDWELCWHV